MDNPNRYRVSSKFTMVKIGVCIGFFSIVVNLVRDYNNDTFTQKGITGLVLSTLALGGILYYVGTRKIIEYDDVKHILYVLDHKKQSETEIPVEKIDEILLSAVGIRNTNNSYIIVYRDFHNQTQKVRLFTIPFKDDIDVLIADTKYKNPQVIVRKWSIG